MGSGLLWPRVLELRVTCCTGSKHFKISWDFNPSVVGIEGLESNRFWDMLVEGTLKQKPLQKTLYQGTACRNPERNPNLKTLSPKPETL